MTAWLRCACGHSFTVGDDKAGGYVNCPQCEHAVKVPGLRDPFWRVLQVGAGVVWIVGVAFAWQAAGPAIGLLAAVGGVLLLWALSKAL